MPFDIWHYHPDQHLRLDLKCDGCGSPVCTVDVNGLPSTVSATISGRLRSTLREHGVILTKDQPVELSSGTVLGKYVRILCPKCEG